MTNAVTSSQYLTQSPFAILASIRFEKPLWFHHDDLHRHQESVYESQQW